MADIIAIIVVIGAGATVVAQSKERCCGCCFEMGKVSIDLDELSGERAKTSSLKTSQAAAAAAARQRFK